MRADFTIEQKVTVPEMEVDSDEELLARAVLRLNGWITGMVFGILSGLLIFVATIWLVIKGGPVVGPHLGLLSQFFFGYSVTVAGSFIGMGYGLLMGFIAGWVIAWIYNRLVSLRSNR
jgi:hypothetical protein